MIKVTITKVLTTPMSMEDEKKLTSTEIMDLVLDDVSEFLHKANWVVERVDKEG